MSQNKKLRDSDYVALASAFFVICIMLSGVGTWPLVVVAVLVVGFWFIQGLKNKHEFTYVIAFAACLAVAFYGVMSLGEHLPYHMIVFLGVMPRINMAVFSWLHSAVGGEQA